MLAKVTNDHRERARRMIGVGLDEEQVSQMLATHDAERVKLKDIQTIIDKLPKTADDVPIVPGMILYERRTRDGGETWYVTEEKVRAIGAMFGNVQLQADDVNWRCTNMGDNRLYSTREAAEASYEPMEK